MLIYYSNLADDAAVAQTVGTPDASFPPENLLNYLAAKVWRGTNGTSKIRIDLGSSGAGAADWKLILYGLSSIEACTIEGSNDGAFGTISYTATVFSSAPAGGVATLTVAAANTVYRYYRLTFTSAANTPQCSRVYLGTILDTGSIGDPDYGGYTRDFAERSNKDYSILGQKFAEQRAQYAVRTMTLPAVTEAVQAELRAWWAAVGTWKPFFVTLSSVSPLDDVFYGTLQAPAKEALIDFGASWVWRVPFTMEQQL